LIQSLYDGVAECVRHTSGW